MILVIDSGATNSNWKLLKDDETFTFRRYNGFNLSTHDISQFPIPEESADYENVKKVFFFGAGTGNESKEMIIKKKLHKLCPNTKSIILGSDLILSGLANCYEERGIVSILGTGSNCCLFNSNKIERKVNNLGYILGDEGSGFAIGRYILKDYYYHQMEEEDQFKFSRKYQISRDDLISKVYHESKNPNTYIASFTDFLNISSPEYRKQVVELSFQKFIERQLKDLIDDNDMKCHFSGSIAWYFKDILEELIINYGLKIGNIIQNPIDSLTYSKLEQIQN